MAEIYICEKCNIVLTDIHVRNIMYIMWYEKGYAIGGNDIHTEYRNKIPHSFWYNDKQFDKTTYNLECSNCHTDRIKIVEITDTLFYKLWQFHSDLKDQPFKHYGIPLNNPETEALFKEFIFEQELLREG